jgi:hypothetical protein
MTCWSHGAWHVEVMVHDMLKSWCMTCWSHGVWHVEVMVHDMLKSWRMTCWSRGAWHVEVMVHDMLKSWSLTRLPTSHIPLTCGLTRMMVMTCCTLGELDFGFSISNNWIWIGKRILRSKKKRRFLYFHVFLIENVFLGPEKEKKPLSRIKYIFLQMGRDGYQKSVFLC